MRAFQTDNQRERNELFIAKGYELINTLADGDCTYAFYLAPGSTKGSKIRVLVVYDQYNTYKVFTCQQARGLP